MKTMARGDQRRCCPATTVSHGESKEATMLIEGEAERRSAQRHRVLKKGRIVLNTGFSTLDCMVRNLSDGGAKLLVNSVVGVPDRFELSIDHGGRQPCRVAWRQLNELGVAFSVDA